MTIQIESGTFAYQEVVQAENLQETSSFSVTGSSHFYVTSLSYNKIPQDIFLCLTAETPPVSTALPSMFAF